MLVEQLIRQLERYPRNEEIYVEYWDKWTAEANAEVTLTDDEWEDVVYRMEEGELYHGTSSYLSDYCQEAVENRKEK
jgi:predicted transcriptional regulator